MRSQVAEPSGDSQKYEECALHRVIIMIYLAQLPFRPCESPRRQPFVRYMYFTVPPLVVVVAAAVVVVVVVVVRCMVAVCCFSMK